MGLLARYGGSLRIRPLLQASGLSCDELSAVLNELAQRRWLEVTWRGTPRPRSPERLRRVDRITTTRWGRSRMLRCDRHTGTQRPRRRTR